jgi:hypothetical protein
MFHLLFEKKTIPFLTEYNDVSQIYDRILQKQLIDLEPKMTHSVQFSLIVERFYFTGLKS